IQTLGMVTVGQRHAIQQLHAETSASNSKVDDRLNELKKVNEMFTEELKNQELITKGFYEHLIETRIQTLTAHQSGSDSEEDIPLAVRRQTKSRSVDFDPISEDEDIHQPPKEKTKKAKKVEVTDPKKPKRGPGRPRKHPLPDSAP
ncbi:hypothetical protein U1Q18_052006, partial [Sarracenia purpurea var. burkii]